RRWRVTRSVDRGRLAFGLGSIVADRLLPSALVGAVLDDLAPATTPRELAITGHAARRAADPLRRPRARGRGEPAAALGASPARDHAQSLPGADEGAPATPGRHGGRAW